MLLNKIDLLDSLIMLRQRTNAATDQHIAFFAAGPEEASH